MSETRGICPSCQRSITLTKKGRIFKHGSKVRFVFPPEPCPGTGQEPLTEDDL